MSAPGSVAWEMEEHELSEGFSCIVYDERGIAIVDHLDRKTANLIAAAPDLYEALDEMVHDALAGDPPGSPAFHQALAALAKARGETL